MFNHEISQISDIVKRRMEFLSPGDKMQDLPEELWHDSFKRDMRDPNRKGGPNLRIMRLDPNDRCLTVTTQVFSKFVHPVEDRYITEREGARLQGFPDDHAFMGTLTSVRKQIGNAVPVELGSAIFRSIVKELPARDRHMCISLFSGAGGLDVALKSLGGSRLSTLAMIDNDYDCFETLVHNFGRESHIICGDLSVLDASSMLEMCGYAGEISIVYGGPPCQSFSQGGKQGGINDGRGLLIFDFVRIVDEMRPLFFLLENVSNLRGVSGGEVYQLLLERLGELGYHVTHGLLDASHYGSPQKRKRLIFVGARDDLGITPSLPHRTHGHADDMFGLEPFVTVGQALAGLPAPRK
jgi:DNA (cytosine-5)-methyltransferase 1